MALPNFPGFSGGTFSLNGKVKANTSKNGNTINSNYNLSDFEDLAMQYVQETIAKKLPELNVFSADVIKDINTQVDAFKNNAVKQINSVYEPMLNNLKNDIASRFGSFSNSTFLNNLNNLESKRADAISSLVQDVLTRKNELQGNELAKRYNFLNFLNNYQNSMYNNIFNALGLTQQNSSMGNAYNTNAYNKAYSDYTYNQKIQNDASAYANQQLMAMLMAATM